MIESQSALARGRYPADFERRTLSAPALTANYNLCQSQPMRMLRCTLWTAFLIV
jgi:hypothetical protein